MSNVEKTDGPSPDIAPLHPDAVSSRQSGRAWSMWDAKLGRELVTILQEHVGETGKNEGAVDVLNRLLREHRCPLKR